MKINAGRLPESWDENPDQLQQKDLDARSNDETFVKNQPTSGSRYAIAWFQRNIL